MSYAGCWRRYFARTFDLIWQGLIPLVFFKLAVLHVNIDYQMMQLSIVILWLPVCLLIDGLCYLAFSNTPGKYLAGIAVTDNTGKPIDGKAYCERNIYVWLSGMCFGIPVLNWIASIYQAVSVARKNRTSYDYSTNSEVRVVKKGIFTFILFPAFIVLVMFAGIIYDM